MTNINLEQTALQKRMAHMAAWMKANNVGYGAVVLLVTLVALSALASVNFAPTPGRVFLTGELATSTIVADYSFIIKDNSATANRRDQMKAIQPLVCDLSPDGLNALRHRVQTFFTTVNATSSDQARETVRGQFTDQTGLEMPLFIFDILSQHETQSLVLEQVLPWMEQRFADGIVSDIRLLLGFRGGVLVRNMRDGQETMYTEPQVIPDIRMAETELGLMLRSLPNRTPGSRRAAQMMINAFIAPTLTPNYELTKTRSNAVLEAMEPSIYNVQRGEVIVRQGERVTPEQQFKLHALGQRKIDRFKHAQFLGLLLISVIMMSGVFFSPNGTRSVPIEQKDMLFMAMIATIVSLSAKGLLMLGERLMEANPNFSPESLAYALPIAGFAGLSSLLFSTRRYVVNGLLLSLFGAAMYKFSLGLFLFYFFSSMWNTRLIVRTQTRQDVVKAICPLLVGMFVMWAGATFMQGGQHNRYFQEAIAVLAGGLLSMFVVFSFAPLMEMIFGYVTRFRLMELLNLDQPVLRELMIAAPGTYHHSLIVSQLVESGAKAIDAQALLCKVAALYHDIGKLSRPEYFIENQFGGDNPHDRLAPSMSSLILLSHVKKGGELAQEYRLGTEVTDIIKQHHGTNVMTYFYKRAQDLGENPNVADYSYPGPKAQTREAALVMLADIVEASCRTLDDPTPSRLQQHINNVIKGLFSSGQLDETNLTLRDLNRLSKSFLHVLVGLFHQRIKYPDKLAVRTEPEKIRSGPEILTAPKLETDEPAAAPQQ